VRTALKIRFVTACGWETMITCEPSTSTMSAPARWAMERTTSLPAFAFVGGEGGHEDQADDAGGGGGGVGDHRPAVGVADQQHGAVNLV
jgi:hypothetical protein